MNEWNPASYLKYENERTQPAYDLVSRIDIASPAHIIDIGCGPGNSTRVLREKWPHAQITGLDSSKEMIEKAQQAYPQETWILADVGEWKTNDTYDLVFSNAAIQWLPYHEVLIRQLWAMVNKRGALAVQVPANNGSPLHQAVLSVSHQESWREFMVGCAELLTYHDAGFYYDQLSAISKRIDVWQTTYYHRMNSHQGLIEWYASTGLKPYLARLTSDSQKKLFQEQVLDECRPYYPQQRDHQILFPFNRLFFVAYQE